MPLAHLENVNLYYEWGGLAEGQVLILSNSLGTNLAMWDQAVEHLAMNFRILRYDTRGHGRSGTPPGEYTLQKLADDVIALMDYLTISRAAMCGVSLGGLTALCLAVEYPNRFTSLIAANTAARIGTPDRWEERIAKVRKLGLAADGGRDADTLVYSCISSGTGRNSLTRTHDVLCYRSARLHRLLRRSEDADLCGRISAIRIPTLLVAGAADPVTAPSDAAYLRENIAGSFVVELPGAHLASIENAQQFAQAVSEFLKKARGRASWIKQRGMRKA